MKFLVALPQPVPGLVIRYSYLWLEEHRKGQEEGVKDRPCAVILVTQDAEGEQLVTVLPVTHSTPTNPSLAIEIPAETKRRLGLDDARSWVVLTEANQFTWPGQDLRPSVQGDMGSVAYGLLPRAFYLQLRARFVAVLKAGGAGP
ncbi:MAG: hypothetical protein WCA78_16130 [Rhizomicrobium sp.]